MVQTSPSNEKKHDDYQLKLQKVFEKIDKIEEDRLKENKKILNKYRKILKQNIKHKVLN